MNNITILYIDDEVNNLHSFKARYRHLYKVLTANSSSEAEEYLSTNPSIHIIISDQRMPDKTGIEFFESILHKYPDPIRILLTGYSDISAVIDAINKGQVFRYIEKPWDDQQMQLVIENAYKFYFVNEQLKQKHKELLKTNEELNRFAYSASHDLKAPVKSMLGILKLAQNETEDRHNLTNLMRKSVLKLDYFISNIIDYYKNTRQEKVNNQIDFHKIIEESLESIFTLQNTSIDDINFNTTITQEAPFESDEFRVSVIISYLLSNAVKYQRQEERFKKIDVIISNNERKATIIVRDNGIGIPDEYKDRIYDMFFRGSTQSTGSGIGLYIVKETIDKLGGSIQCYSMEGEGTEFKISLPNEMVRELSLR